MRRLLPPVLIEKDASGTTFIAVERHDVPLAYAGICSPGGMSVPHPSGLNEIAAGLLSEGSSKTDSLRWRTHLDRHAIGLSVWPSEIFWSIGVDSLSIDFSMAVDAMADLAASPRMPQSEWKRLVKERETAAASAWRSPQFILHWMSQIQLLGRGHANAAPGVVGGFKALKFEDAEKTGRTAFGYGPGAAIYACGDIDPAKTIDMLRQTFSNLPSTRKLLPLREPRYFRPTTWIVDAPMSQVFFAISRRGIRRGDPDRLALRLFNRALGGGFSSRLFRSTREEFGQTYHISSSLSEGHQDHPFSIRSFTETDKLGAMLYHIYKTLLEVRDDGFTEEEIDAAREGLSGSLPLSLTSPTAVLWHVFDGWESHLTPAQLEEEWLALRDVSREAVNAAARRILGDLSYQLTLVGPEGKMRYFLQHRPLGIATIPINDVGQARYWPKDLYDPATYM